MKKKLFFLVSIVATFLMSVSVFADPVPMSTDMAGIIGSSLTGLSGDILAVIAVIVPVALGIWVAIIAARWGIRVLRSLTSG
jgi:chromate transport protein ChrA